MPPSSIWDVVKKRLCQVFSPVAPKVHAATEIHSRTPGCKWNTAIVYPKIHWFGNTCSRCKPHISDLSSNYSSSLKDTLSIKKIRSKLLVQRTFIPLRHIMTLAQEAEIRLKKYEGLNGYDPSVMQATDVWHSEVLAVQGQSSPHGNNLESN